MSEATKNSVSFDPSQLVLTSGASSAIEILSFCLADSGNAFLVPTPCSPGYNFMSILFDPMLMLREILNGDILFVQI